MKRILLMALALTMGIAAGAQESNVMLGVGLFGETGNRADNVFPGLALRLSYGLDLRLGEKWSVMPGAGIQARQAEINHLGWVGGDPDGMTMADAFCQIRYHYEWQDTDMVFGLGPQVFYMVTPDHYYIDADPDDPRNGKEKFGKWDIGLQPALIFQTRKHFQWGFEANVGLRNMLHQYPEYNVTGSVHLHSFMFVCGWRF